MESTPLLLLRREASTDAGTFGVLTLPDGWQCQTLELPWRDNRRQRSCIPTGVYRCSIVQSPRFGRVYGVHDVPGRSHILFHSGNWAGDVELGLRTHVEGCILVGLRRGVLEGQPAVLASRDGLRQFMDRMAGAAFTLEVAGE